jgi:hypothetical protein
MATQNNSYPYPSTLNIGNFVSIKLIRTNYLRWKTQMLCSNENQELYNFIDGETSPPPEMAPA